MSKPPAVISVIVVDGDARIRSALTELLDGVEDFRVVGEAADGPAAVLLAQGHEDALVLVDVRMAYGGRDLVRVLTALSHRPVVVGLSANSDTATWTGMLAAGCSGYLLKGAIAEDLPLLLRRCAAGELIVAVPGAADVIRRSLLEAR